MSACLNLATLITLILDCLKLAQMFMLIKHKKSDRQIKINMTE